MSRRREERRLRHVLEVVRTLPRAETPTDCVLYLRTSGRTQKQLASLNASAELVPRDLEAKGWRPAEVFRETETGRRVCRPVLIEAIEAARRRGCPLVVESLSRLLRHFASDWDAPTVAQMIELRALLDGVPVYSVTSPTTAYWIVASDRIRARRGLPRARTKPGPRGPRRSAEEWARLVEAFRNRDCPVREFARREGVSIESLYAWERRLGGAF